MEAGSHGQEVRKNMTMATSWYIAEVLVGLQPEQ